MQNKKRSPILYRPLNNPGESLEKRRNALLEENVAYPLLSATIAIAFTGVAWWNYHHPIIATHILLLVMTIFLLSQAIWKIWRVWPELAQIKQGVEGEKAVGQYLERLRERGYQVFHDLQGKDFNVDHVIIGPGGVFTIETKTLAKPMRGETKLHFDGESIVINGKPLPRNPVHQAKAQANWMRNVLSESTGREYEVWPVVLFPGWFIEHKPGALREVWVLEAKALSKFLENEKTVLTLEDVKLASSHLSRYIRTQDLNKH